VETTEQEKQYEKYKYLPINNTNVHILVDARGNAENKEVIIKTVDITIDNPLKITCHTQILLNCYTYINGCKT